MRAATPALAADNLTGLVRWVMDIPVEPGEPRIFNASVKMADTTRYSPHPCYDNNGGSGLTEGAARGAAIGEGLERYCASQFAPQDLVFGTVDELSRKHVLFEPGSFAMFHPDQPGDFTPAGRDTLLGWAWAWAPIEARPVLVPASVVYMPYFPCRAELGERPAGPSMSTGLACARDLDTALLKGIWECVERDAFMITWMNRLPVPRVDIDSHPALARLHAERLRRDGLRYLLFRTTLDLPIASFLCLLVDERRSPPMISAGGAAGLDPVAAAAKAMTEAVQTREWAKFLGRNGARFAFAEDFSDIRDFEDHVALYAYGDLGHAIRFLLDGDRATAGDGWEGRGTGNARQDLQQTLDILRDAGLRIAALDLTVPDVEAAGLRVARAVMPDLQPLDADYRHRFLGGTRLYDVPVRLGYREGPLRLDELNPYPHPFP
jgi:ribosomal protein S12 methylthiotransferase accessory factor